MPGLASNFWRLADASVSYARIDSSCTPHCCGFNNEKSLAFEVRLHFNFMWFLSLTHAVNEKRAGNQNTLLFSAAMIVT